jgi:hypothetical protein
MQLLGVNTYKPEGERSHANVQVSKQKKSQLQVLFEVNEECRQEVCSQQFTRPHFSPKKKIFG